jgi:hypothetical protein
LLITLVEERPAIWDKTLHCYKDKKLKESEWREICVILKENFEELQHKRIQEYGKFLCNKYMTRNVFSFVSGARQGASASEYGKKPKRVNTS